MQPIRVHLLVLVLGAMLPGALLTGIVSSGGHSPTIARSANVVCLESARVDASALDREFPSTIGTLDALAASPALDAGDLERFYLDARRVQPCGGPEHLFAIRVPVLRQDRIVYVLSAIVDVDALARVIPAQRSDSEEWTRVIIDPAGTVAVRTRGAEGYIGSKANQDFRDRIAQSRESVTSETTREGVAVYAAFSRSAFGWTTVVVVPRSLLDAPLFTSMAGVLIGGAVLILCGLAAVLSVSRRLSSDLASATAAAEAVAEGRPVPLAAAHLAETHQLQRSLASTASLLEKRLRERDEEIRRADQVRADAEQANRTKDGVGVLDIGLPGMSGYELARHLRAAHPGIRLIALTGYGQRWDLQAASDAGFDAHLSKPIATGVLLDRIAGDAVSEP